MNKLPYHNDQASIAEHFLDLDDHITQTARIAFFKINSYKLSLIHAAFCMSREELSNAIKGTLLNYAPPVNILNEIGFFANEVEN